MTTAAFYRTVGRTSGEPDRGLIKRATAAVFHALRDRLTPEAALKEQLTPGEAEDVLAQLPKDLKELWAEAQATV